MRVARLFLYSNASNRVTVQAIVSTHTRSRCNQVWSCVKF